MAINKHKVLKILVKIISIFIISVVLLFFVVKLIIIIPAVQNKLKNKTVAIIQEKLKTNVFIGNIGINFPKKLNVNELLILEDNNDTLVYLGNFSVSARIFPLLKHRIILNEIELKDSKADFGKLIDRIPEETSADTEAESSDSKPWEFSINTLKFETCYFKYRDNSEEGFELILDLGKVNARIGFVNIDTLIKISYIETEDSYVSYQNLSTTKSEKNSHIEFADICIDKVNLQNSIFSYIDSISGVILNIDGKNINANDILADITRDSVLIKKAAANNLFVDVLLLPKKDTLPETNDFLNWGESLSDWKIEGNELKVKNSRIKISSAETLNPSGHFNSDHLDFNNLTGTLNNFKLAKNILDAEIENFSGREMNGLDVLQLDADIKTTPTDFLINRLKLQTPAANYNIRLQTTVSPTNYLDIENKTLNLDLDITGKTWQDMDYFYPFLEGNAILMKSFNNNPFQIKTKISGKTENLVVEQFDFQYLNSTRILVNGEFKNISSPIEREINFELQDISITKKDIDKTFNPFLPDSVLSIPESINLSGKLSGKSDKFWFTGKLSTDNNGNISINNLLADLSENPEYKADILIDLKNLNNVIHNEINRVKLGFEGSFSGKDVYSSTGSVNLTVDTITWLKHSYTGITFAGGLNNGNYSADLVSLDSSITLTANLLGKYYQNEKIGQLRLNIENIDLKRLNLFPKEFKVEGNTFISADFVSENEFNTSVNLKDLNFYFSDTVYQMHPIDISFTSNEQLTNLKLESFFYNLEFNSSGSWQKMVDGIDNLPQLYLKSEKSDTIKNTMPEFNLKGKLEYPEVFVNQLFPELPSFHSLIINGNYSKSTDELNFDFQIPGLNLNGVTSDSLRFSLKGNSEEIHFNGFSLLNINDLLAGKLKFDGNIDHSKMKTTIQYFDSQAGKYMDLNTLFWADTSNYYISFIPDSLTFSYDKWNIQPDNLVTINKSNISFSDFELASDEQKILIQSGTEDKKDFLRLQLIDFGMGSIENIMAKDTLIYGIANADFLFTDIFANPEITGKLSVDSMYISDFDLGKFEISKFYFGGNELNYDLSIQGTNENIQSTGMIDLGEKNVDVSFNINKLNLKELEYLLADKISDPKGNLEADFKITGTTESPNINGNINFQDAGLGIKMLNEYFTLGNEHISFENSLVRFNNLTLTNQNGRAAHVNGTILLNPEAIGRQNLTISTDNMEFLNTTEKDNKVYYGFLKAQTNFQLSGTSSALKVDARTKVDKTTSLTYVFPDVLTLDDSKGIVSFDPYNQDSVDLNIYKDENERLKSLALESLKASLELESGTKFKIYFDESATDYLDAVLNGNINYILDGGNSDISGVMSIVEGKLHYSLPMVGVKDYTIEPGSSITIANDVYNPYLNIVASTTVRASTEKLIQDYVKVMNFTVLLKMFGELNNMKLEFDISSETDDVIVSSKLAQLSAEERNVNALNLLVRGSFTITLKSDEVGSASTSDAAIDKFYSEQLNHLISENVHFVDVNFDVQSFSDYGNYGETINRRNYYYNVGKSFFNNRARINYKGSFDFSNSQEEQSMNTQFVQNELDLEIGITNDGSLKALFFNRNKYEGILEGKVMETGGGLKIEKGYYSIKDIFDGNQEKKQRNKSK